MKNLWIAGLFFALSVQAQDVYLYGKITDTTGNPVEGVEVRLFNAELIDTTDAEGNYSFGSEPIEKPEYLDGIAQKINKIQFDGRNFIFTSATSTKAIIKLYDIKGRLLENLHDGILTEGVTTIPVTTKNAAEMLLLSVESDGSILSYKIPPYTSGLLTLSDSYKNTKKSSPAVKSSTITDWFQASKIIPNEPEDENYPSVIEQIDPTIGEMNIENFGKKGYYIKICGSRWNGIFHEPDAPGPPDNGYRHIQFKLPTTNEDFQSDGNAKIDMNSNGSRVAAAYASGLSDDSAYIIMYDVTNETLLWKHTRRRNDLIINLKMSEDGRSIIASDDKNKVFYFEEDSNQPKWWIEPVRGRYHDVTKKVLDIKYAWDGLKIAIGMNSYFSYDFEKYHEDTDKYSQEIYILGRANGTPLYYYKFQIRTTYLNSSQASYYKYDLSDDGETVAIIAKGQHPDDPLGLDESLNYIHNRIMCFRSGEFLWDYWLMADLPEGADSLSETFKTYDYCRRVFIDVTNDGNYVLAAGIGSQIVKIETATGNVVWNDYLLAPSYYDISESWGVVEFLNYSASADGNRIIVHSQPFDIISYKFLGLTYYDLTQSDEPIWHTLEVKNKTHADYSIFEDAQPFGYEMDVFYEYPQSPLTYYSLSQSPYSLIADDLCNTFLISTDFGEDIAVYYHGAPIPFHRFHLDRTINTDIIHFENQVISGNGTYMAAISKPYYTYKDGRKILVGPTDQFYLNIVEIPPGVIINTKELATMQIHGGSSVYSYVLEDGLDVDKMIVDVHVVKPGKEANLSLNLQLQPEIEAALSFGTFPPFCLPWQTDKDWTYEMNSGFKYKKEEIEWTTPDCWFNYIISGGIPTTMSLHGMLYNEDIAVCEAYDTYFNFTIIIPEE